MILPLNTEITTEISFNRRRKIFRTNVIVANRNLQDENHLKNTFQVISYGRIRHNIVLVGSSKE